MISNVSKYEVMINYPLFIKLFENCVAVCIFAKSVSFTWKVHHDQSFYLEYSLKYPDRID